MEITSKSFKVKFQCHQNRWTCSSCHEEVIIKHTYTYIIIRTDTATEASSRPLLSSVLSVILLDSFGVTSILLGDLSPSLKGKGASYPWPTTYTNRELHKCINLEYRPGCLCTELGWIKQQQTTEGRKLFQTVVRVCKRKKMITCCSKPQNHKNQGSVLINNFAFSNAEKKHKSCQLNNSSSTCVTEQESKHSPFRTSNTTITIFEQEKCNNIYWNSEQQTCPLWILMVCETSETKNQCIIYPTWNFTLKTNNKILTSSECIYIQTKIFAQEN